MPDKTELRIRWDSMLNRVRGNVCDGCGKPRWKGLEVGWPNFHAFRDWAHVNGWVPGLVLDRIDSSKGYLPGNCQWISKRANDNKARHQHKSDCKCFWCRKVRATYLPESLADAEPF